MVNNTMVVDSTSEKRKVNKPLIEKKRRARINNCLMQLKRIVLEATGRNSESAANSKLEKADILEMTVQHLERLHRRQQHRRTETTASTSTSYRTGYAACTNEAIRYIDFTNQIQEQARHNQDHRNVYCQTAARQREDTQYTDSRRPADNYSNCVPVSAQGVNHCYNSITLMSSNCLPIFSHSTGSDINLTFNSFGLDSAQNVSENKNNVSNEQVNNNQELNNQNNNAVWRPW